MRIPIMAGNWKMNCTNDEACALACALAEKSGNVEGCEVVLCPPATALSTVAGCVKDTKIEVGAQNMLWESKGAFTGEISAPMILSTGAKWVIIGHSERRGRMSKLPDGWTEDLMSVFGDTDHSVNVKVKAALAAGLKPIVACGETEAEYDAGETEAIVSGQVRAMLEGFSPDEVAKLVIAYEPVWAIGTGKACESDPANDVCGLIRTTVSEMVGVEVAEGIRILYGGSVSPKNVAELMGKPQIDGGLVGGASLKADDFATLISVAAG